MDPFDIFDFDIWPIDIERELKSLNKLLKTRVPAIDLTDEGDSFKLVADLPGMSKDEVHVRVDPDKIVIRAEKKKEKETEEKNYYIAERKNVRYFRVISLPEEVDPDSAKAKFDNGTLEITVKKAKQKKEVKIE
jgi:HSP20 family protein